MQAYGGQNALQSYKEFGVQAEAAEANPHALVQMLFDGAVGRVAAAHGAIEAGETTRKCEMIGQAIDIIQGLRLSLNQESGGDLTENLDALYDYMERRLVEANLHNDASIVGEVAGLLRELQSGWRAIADSINGTGEPAAAGSGTMSAGAAEKTEPIRGQA